MLFRRALAPCALLAALPATAVAQTPLHLIPQPQVVTPRGEQAISGAEISCPGCDPEDTFAANDLRETLAARGLPTTGGLRIVLERNGQGFSPAMQAEGYTIVYGNGTLTLRGATAEGVFYAAQTAKQLVERNLGGGFTLHAADIRDWPVLRYRGLSDDLSRGPVDTLAFQEKIVRELAAYKDNIYSPYFEHTQQYASNPLPAPPGGALSAADARALVAYARPYHVTVIPEQEAFGHLHHNLNFEQYADVAETPHGDVLAPGQPGSLPIIKQEFTELAALYPSPFLHVGADETQNLGTGRTRAEVTSQGLGAVYLQFMQRIDTTLAPLHRTILFWGDIAQDVPDLLKTMPPEFKATTIAVPWWYEPRKAGYDRYIEPFRAAGFQTWVAPGISNWSRVYPNWANAMPNIQQFTLDGVKLGATGQLNTIWYDDGEALAANNWFGILFGAAQAWQGGTGTEADFEASYGPVFHGDLTGKLDQAQREVMAAHEILKTEAKVGDGSDGLFWMDPWSKDGQVYAAKLRPYVHEMRLHAEKALQLIAEARAAYPATTAASESTPPLPGEPPLSTDYAATSLREPEAIDALELGARRLDFIGLKFQLCDEMATEYPQMQADAASPDHKTRARVFLDFAQIRGVDGKLEDIVDGYSQLRDLYSQIWLTTNRYYGLRPVQEHFDYTVGLWYARIDRIRSAQRQYDETKILPSAADLGIPAPPPPTSNAAAGPGAR